MGNDVSALKPDAVELEAVLDGELLRAYTQDGSHEAFAAIVKRYGPLVMGVCRRALRNGGEAEDAFQATFLVLARKASSIRDADCLSDWLFGVALRVARKANAADSRRRSHLERFIEMIRSNPSKPNVATDLECELDEQISRLPERLRKVIVLCHLQGLTKREAAVRLGWPEGTISTRLAQARELLKERLAARGYGAPAEALGPTALAPVPAALCASTLKASLGTGASAKALALSDALVRAMNAARLKLAGFGAGVFVCAVAGVIGVSMAVRGKSPTPVAAGPPSPAQPVQVAQATPTSRPTSWVSPFASDVSAAQLVRDVRHSEDWIEHVDSFCVVVESVWTRSPESRAAREAELKRQFPNLTIDEKRFPDLRMRMTDTLVMAFDKTRCFKQQDRPGDSNTLSMWDGKKAMGHQFYVSNSQESYWLDKSIDNFSRSFFSSETSWPRAGHHRYWWTSSKDPVFPDDSPELYEVIGRETYKGIDCWVLNQGGYNFGRWYVGVNDHLLHSLMMGTLRNNPATPGLLKAFGDEHGQTFATTQDVYKWTRTLPRDRGDELYMEFLTRLHRTDRPMFEHWMLDYKEVTPGGWYPMTQGYIIRQGDFDKSFESTHRDIQIAEVKVNQPLKDEWFTMEMKEGVQVGDRLSDLTLFYKYKKNMTAEEWDAVVQEAQKRDQDALARQRTQDLALGKPAPAFPPRGQWLNSKPITWADFRGKVVIVDFFADWCGPCRNDYPALVQMNKDRENSGIYILGIHTPGSGKEAIEKLMKDYSITYPVFVDVPAPPGVQSWGTVYSAFGVTAIPHSFLIDQNGQVVSHGMLGEIVGKARELRNKTKKAG